MKLQTMAKRNFWTGILAIVLVFGMTVIACDNGTTNGNGNGSGNGNGNGGGINGGETGGTQIGHNLVLGGQVFTFDENNLTYSQFTGNRTIQGLIHGGPPGPGWNQISAGTGTITNGQFSFNTGTPSVLLPSVHFPFAIGVPTSVSPSGAQFNELWFQQQSGGWFGTEKTLSSFDFVANEGPVEVFWFFYFDQNVTISSPGGTTGASGQYIFNPFNINLQAGWNVIRVHAVFSSTGAAHTVSLGNLANVRWVQED